MYKCALHDSSLRSSGRETCGNYSQHFYHRIALMTNHTTPPAPESTPAKKTKLEIAREKAAKAAALLQKLEAQARAKQAGQERKLDTRRKVLLGAYLATKIQKDDDLRMQTLAGLDKYLTRPAERALFDLPPLAPKPAEAQVQSTGPIVQEQAPALSAGSGEHMPQAQSVV